MRYEIRGTMCEVKETLLCILYFVPRISNLALAKVEIEIS
jgi:hypothetical protein